jgi:acetaldehyde dehydrogenase (acetylating)
MPEREKRSGGHADRLVELARTAQTALAGFDQARIDRICEAMASAAMREALRLGALAVQETGFGIAEDKAEKNRFAARDVWNYFSKLRTVGIVSETREVIEIASPRGVVAAIIPSTNPTSTAIFKALISIKSRNTIVMSPHPSAINCINETVNVVREAAVAEGLPAEAIQCMTEASIDETQSLMKNKYTAVILATGGLGLVRAAYSSGKPAFGVGPGNVPVFIERSADITKAVSDILTGKCFDNGTICASEQAVVADSPVAAEVKDQFTRQGAYFLNRSEIDQLGRLVVTEKRTLNPAIVGKSVFVIAKMAGLSIPVGTRCLMAEIDGVGRDFPLSIEKLSPILAFYIEEGLERAANRCLQVLSYGGMGHTAGIHTRSRDVAKLFGMEMPASRIVVNTPTTHGAIGFSTSLPPSMTLGCGSWGGNVTSDNISPLHLMDIKRVAFETRPVRNRAEEVAEPALAATVKRNEVAAIVDRFLNQRSAHVPGIESPEQPEVIKPVQAEKVSGNGTQNGQQSVDFVCEDDVRRAMEKGVKIYINARTIITPAARDLGESAEVFSKF